MLILWCATAGATEHASPVQFPRPRDWTWSRAGFMARTTFLPAALPELGMEAGGAIVGLEFGMMIAIGYAPTGVPFPYTPQRGDQNAWTLAVEVEYTLGHVLGRLNVGDVALVPSLDVGFATSSYLTSSATGAGLRTGRFDEIGPLAGANLDLWTLRRGHGLVHGWGFRLAVQDRIQPYVADGRTGVLHRPSVSVSFQAMRGHRWRTRREGNVRS